MLVIPKLQSISTNIKMVGLSWYSRKCQNVSLQIKLFSEVRSHTMIHFYRSWNAAKALQIAKAGDSIRRSKLLSSRLIVWGNVMRWSCKSRDNLSEMHIGRRRLHKKIGRSKQESSQLSEDLCQEFIISPVNSNVQSVFYHAVHYECDQYFTQRWHLRKCQGVT